MNPVTQKKEKRIPTVSLILCGLFAALTAILSQIILPLPFTPVPINLATLSVLLSGGLLGAKWGFTSQVVYIFIGACGLPVFAGFSGGFHAIVGPTGGYIVGYALAAFLAGFLMDGHPKHPVFPPAAPSAPPSASQQVSRSASFAPLAFLRPILAMTAATLACYLLGTAWFMYQTHTGLLVSLIACVFPFLPGDALKIVVAVLLIRSLRPFVRRSV